VSGIIYKDKVKMAREEEEDVNLQKTRCSRDSQKPYLLGTFLRELIRLPNCGYLEGCTA